MPFSTFASLVIILLLGNPHFASSQPAPSILRAMEHEVISLVHKVEPSVVAIVTQRRTILPNGRVILERSVGSGVVVHVDGYILTTDNVVDRADWIHVSFPDGQQRPARLVGKDQLTGIAVVSVDSVTVLPAELGDSDMVSPGSWAIMMGNTYGLTPSVSIGLVNGMRAEDGLMQVSAMASTNTSGGAVFGADARVIGLIAAQIAHSSQQRIATGQDGLVVDGLNELSRPDGGVLVIPINQVRMFAEQLMKYGEVRRSWLGVDVEQSWYSIDMGDNVVGVVESHQGLQVTRIHPNSPAEKSGLRMGDQIVAVNDLPMSHYIRLAEYVTSVPIGSEIEIQYVRGNSILSTIAILELPPRGAEEYDRPGTLAQSPALMSPTTEDAMSQDRTLQWLMDIDHRLRVFERQLRDDRARIDTSSGTRP
ncbi:MAG: PDZ domain-containing protein [Candidatus Latescibacteria bacterium]|nr:PDZ domain-containing protein [Candidatus Latescibacterota bacterium]